MCTLELIINGNSADIVFRRYFAILTFSTSLSFPHFPYERDERANYRHLLTHLFSFSFLIEMFPLSFIFSVSLILLLLLCILFL